jgi:hypothetical protein
MPHETTRVLVGIVVGLAIWVFVGFLVLRAIFGDTPPFMD